MGALIGVVVHAMGHLTARGVEKIAGGVLRLRRRNQESNVYRFTPFQISTGTPAWLIALWESFRERLWTAVYRHGSPMLADRALPNDVAWAHHMVGVAAFHLGYYEDAIALLRRALDLTTDSALRAHVTANLAGFYSHVHEYDLALKCADEALGIDSTKLIALFNALCAASRAHRVPEMWTRAKALVDAHPDADDPGSQLGREVSSEPALENMRNSEVFAAKFPKLSAASRVRGRAGAAAIGVIILLAGILLPLVAWAEMFG